jgi:hypothetical protein
VTAGNEIAFVIRDRADLRALEVVPQIDGALLTDLVDAYELAHAMLPAGSAYGGLIPAFYRFGAMDRHYRGGSTETFGPVTPVLGGECGEWGCWPLLARISVSDDAVTWDAFAQPHRPVRDYSNLGPFHFRRAQYEDALADLSLALA